MRRHLLEELHGTVRRRGLQAEVGEWSIDHELLLLNSEADRLVASEGPALIDTNVRDAVESADRADQRAEPYGPGPDPDASQSP